MATPFSDSNAANLEPFSNSLVAALNAASSMAEGIPLATEYQYMETFPSFRAQMAALGGKLLSLGQRVVDGPTADAGSSKPNFSSVTNSHEADDEYDLVSDVVDSLVERVVRESCLERAVCNDIALSSSCWCCSHRLALIQLAQFLLNALACWFNPKFHRWWPKIPFYHPFY
jgi:hypothetical protein